MKSDAAARRAQVAARIAAEVRHGRTGDVKIAKATSLLHAFRTPGSPTKKYHVLDELQAQGLHVGSGWMFDSGQPDIRPTGSLQLSVADGSVSPIAALDGDETIQLSIWGPNTDPLQERPLPPAPERRGPADVFWFNVDPPEISYTEEPTVEVKQARLLRRTQAVRDGLTTLFEPALDTAPTAETSDPFEARVTHVRERLKDWCPELDEEMIRDLLRQDVQPKVETYGDEKDNVRGVSALAVIAREAPGDLSDSDGVTEELVFQMVEIIVGDGWIVTCWHPSRTFTGTSEPQLGPPLLREPFRSHVHYRWLRDGTDDPSASLKTSGDLGLYLSRSLVDTYGASHRMMERWVASWEGAFYKSLSAKKKAEMLKEAAGEISNMLSLVGEFRRRLTAFEHARWATTDRSWFPGLSDRKQAVVEHDEQSEQVQLLVSSVEAVDGSFALLADNIRADINLLMLQSTATQQESTERIQGYLGKVTGLVLVPTLVAGLFGANTELPGGGTWLGFEIMLVLMITAAVVAYLAIRKLTR